MANKIRIKRRASGASGAPASLENAELAFNEVDNILYYGKGTGGVDGTATTIEAIAGPGAYITLTTDQTITGNKTSNGVTVFNGAVSVPTPSSNAHAATKLYVDDAIANVTISNEVIEDAAAGLFTNGTHSGIAVTYDDTNSKVNLDVADFTITLGGDLEGNVSITNLGNATLTANIAANSVALGTDTTGNYVASVAAGTGITVSNTGTEGGTFTVTNAGVTELTGTANEVTVSASTGSITLSLPSNVTIPNNLIVTGDLTVQGNTTTLNTATLVVEDKNIVLANVSSPDDTTADGAGITILGATNKTLNWVDSTDSWTASEHLDLAAGKEFKIGTASVLSNTTIGNTVINSSLTSVGTIATGVWEGTAVAVLYGGTGAADAANARINLGVAIGSNVQAWSAQLDALAANTATIDGGTF